MDQNLSELGRKLVEAEKFLSVDPEEYPHQTKPGLMIKRRQVEADYEELRAQTKQCLQDEAETVCFIGDASEIIAAAKAKGGPLVAVDVSIPYREIAAQIEMTFRDSSREWNAHHTTVVMTEISVRMADYSPNERMDLNPPDLVPFVCPPGSTTEAVRKVARQIFGDRLAGNVMSKALLTECLKMDLTKGAPAIAVYGVTSATEAEGLRKHWPFSSVVDTKKLKK